MAKYLIEATRTHWYEVEVEATSEEEAYNQLDDWIAEDFEEFQTNAQWDFEIIPQEED